MALSVLTAARRLWEPGNHSDTGLLALEDTAAAIHITKPVTGQAVNRAATR